jgi:hypothetical protein
MTKYQPPGRLSKVSGQEFLIQIQTEFAWHPHPRITTTVVLDGVVIHKIQKDWEGSLESEEEQGVVINYINKQHEEVERIVKSNRDFILNHGRSKKKDVDFQGILRIEGVERAFLLSADGLLTPFRDEEIELEKVKLFESLFDLIEFVDQLTKWGPMNDAYLVVDGDRVMIFRYGDHFIIITIDELASSAETARKVVEFLKAA